MKTVIVGGVAGGATTATRLRRLDEDRKIIMLERGDYISYANCGLPYYVGDVIQDRGALVVETPESISCKFKLDVRTGNEVTKINKENKTIEVKNLKTGEIYEESYDDLVLATGSSPLKPPIPGINNEGIYTIWTIPDTDRIRKIVDTEKPKNVAVIGGGFIGLEMAENLKERGSKVTIIEAQSQVMAPVDPEMAQLVHENMSMNDVDLILGDGVDNFKKEGDSIVITLSSGKTVTSDMVILSIGVRPNSQLAKDAGLELNKRGGIIVNNKMQTSEPGIWAVGDVIEVENFITKQPAMIPLAGPANREARILANNIAGGNDTYKGTMGTSVAKVFDLNVAATGINEKALIADGKVRGKDYFVALINQKSHAGYYPGATPITLKMLFNREGKIFGAQIVGQEGVDKQIDILATAIRLGANIDDLQEVEHAYAPPFSSAKGPVNMLGFVARNVLDGFAVFEDWDKLDGKYVLDITENVEHDLYAIPGAKHIPLCELRARRDELPRDETIVIYCAIGIRSYNAARILEGQGFKDVRILAGGLSFYKSMKYKEFESKGNSRESKESATLIDDKQIEELKILNCSGLQCPGPLMKVSETMKNLEDGAGLRVSATDMGFPRDIEAWCKQTGNTFVNKQRKGTENIVTIQKGNNGVKDKAENLQQKPQGKTMVVFDGDMDKVMAAFIIANGAASMGKPVTMFFTFWGLNALRKTEKIAVKKTFVEKLFGFMMPRGVSKLKISKMNMGGAGTAMMKSIMKKKNVSSLEELMQKAMDNGVKLIACTMSMDVMGITEDELIEGVELAGVGAYLGDAEESNVNLFI